MKSERTPVYMAAALSMFLAIPALAQRQVDNHAGQVDTRVGGELYGNNSDVFRLRPYQVQLLPSEERNAVFRSGMLPSELELNRSSIGPLSPNGVLDYISSRSPLQRAMNLPAPQLYNPSYELTLQPFPNLQQTTVKPGYDPSPNNPQRPIEQAAPLSLLSASAAIPLPNGELSTGQLPSGQLSSRPESLPAPHRITQHPVRHGTLLLKRPSTQPTPAPQPQPQP